MLVAASHPMVRALFVDIGRQSHGSVHVTVVPLDARAVAAASARLATASVAVVDASVDPGEALAACTAIRTDHPDLSIGVVFCCTHATTAADLRAFLAAGVGGLLELELSAEETLGILRGVARGEGAVHLQLAAWSGASLLGRLAGEEHAVALSDHDLALLRLVALGLTDQEIGHRLTLNHHTIKHQIERLRRRVHAKNRVQLAAWAGAQLARSGDPPDATSAEPTGAMNVRAHPCGLVR
jgi:DNA-binding NarL/FixJ family response regulator